MGKRPVTNSRKDCANHNTGTLYAYNPYLLWHKSTFAPLTEMRMLEPKPRDLIHLSNCSCNSSSRFMTVWSISKPSSYMPGCLIPYKCTFRWGWLASSLLITSQCHALDKPSRSMEREGEAGGEDKKHYCKTRGELSNFLGSWATWWKLPVMRRGKTAFHFIMVGPANWSGLFATGWLKYTLRFPPPPKLFVPIHLAWVVKS